MINDKADQVMTRLFQSLPSRCQIGLETSMKGTNLVFECVHLLYGKCHKINPNCVRSYIDSLRTLLQIGNNSHKMGRLFSSR